MDRSWVKSQEAKPPEDRARVVWITGLSGAGKSTLARSLAGALREKSVPCVVIDGDEVRELFGEATEQPGNHERAVRLKYAFRYGKLAQLLARQGVTVIVSTISLIREIHEWNRANLPGYLEVYLRVPLAELRRRDPKGIYRRFDAGQLTNVWGLDLPFDEPEGSDLVVDFRHACTVDETAAQIAALLEKGHS
jgi:adenylylsulfate kinase